MARAFHTAATRASTALRATGMKAQRTSSAMHPHAMELRSVQKARQELHWIQKVGLTRMAIRTVARSQVVVVALYPHHGSTSTWPSAVRVAPWVQ